MNVALDTTPRKNQPALAAAWMLFACLLFALMYLCMKRAMREVGFLEGASGRALFGAIVIWGWARARNVPLKVHDRRTQWARTIAGTTSMFFGFYALSKLPMGDAMTLSNLSPVMIAIASQRVLGERTGSGLFFAVLLGLCGVTLIAGAQFSGHGMLGVGAGVLGAFFSCVAMMFLRRLGPRESAEGVSLHFLVVAGLANLAASLPVFRVPTSFTLLALVGAGLFGGLAQVSMTKAYGHDNAARVGAIGYSGVVMSQLLGLLFLHEVPTLRQLLGAAMIIASGAFVLLAKK